MTAGNQMVGRHRCLRDFFKDFLQGTALLDAVTHC